MERVIVRPKICLNFRNFSLPSALRRMSVGCSAVRCHFLHDVETNCTCYLCAWFGHGILDFWLVWLQKCCQSWVVLRWSIFSCKSSKIRLSYAVFGRCWSCYIFCLCCLSCLYWLLARLPRNCCWSMTRKPEVDFLFSWFIAWSEAEYLTCLKLVVLEYLSPNIWDPLGYRRLSLLLPSGFQWGDCVNLGKTPTTKDISSLVVT